MSREVRTLNVTPLFLRDNPHAAGEIMAEFMERYPDAFWMIFIADREDADTFMETHLFHFAPVEAAESHP